MSATVIYGIQSVIEALESHPRRISRICIQRARRDKRMRRILAVARENAIPVQFEGRDFLDRSADRQRHQGVVCWMAELPTVELETLLEKVPTPGLLVLLDGIEDPRNLGAVLRSCGAAGAGGVVLPARRSARLTPVSVKTSAGAALHVPIARVVNLSRTVEHLRECGYGVTGLVSGTERYLWEIDLTAPTALVLGNEESGLRRLVREKCDQLARIPAPGPIESYNVAVAAGIALYEVVRQRKIGGPRG